MAAAAAADVLPTAVLATVALAIVGPTASGKSALALALARRHPHLELVSVDSMQVYRGMDIGTAKPTPAERAEVPHHLLDLVQPEDDFDLTRFQAEATAALAAIASRGHRAVLVGGTGLYLRGLLDGLTPPGTWPDVRAELDAEGDTAALHARLVALDPAAAARMEPGNRRRVVRALEVCLGSGRPFSSFGPGLGAYPASAVAQVGLRHPREVLTARIAARFDAQLAAGFVEEVARLADRPGRLSRTAGQALGYRELLAYGRGECSRDEAVALAVSRTRRFAVRQDRWFRRDPRITWLDAPNNPMAVLVSLVEALAPCN